MTGEGEAVQAGGGGEGLHVVPGHVTHVVGVRDAHGGARVADPVVPVVTRVGATLPQC